MHLIVFITMRLWLYCLGITTVYNLRGFSINPYRAIPCFLAVVVPASAPNTLAARVHCTPNPTLAPPVLGDQLSSMETHSIAFYGKDPPVRGSDSPPWKRSRMAHRSDSEASRLSLDVTTPGVLQTQGELAGNLNPKFLREGYPCKLDQHRKRTYVTTCHE